MRHILLALASVLALGAPAFAQDWVVSRVRGTAEMQVGQHWLPVERGAVVEQGQILRTGPDGRIGLARGSETIELDADTEISLRDGGAELKTSVIQDHGTLTVDVERRNVQHFSVQTPFLAAVVKGTQFTVTVDDDSAEVNVDRGVVQVQDTENDLVTDILPGQQATVGEDMPLNVSGSGQVAIFTFEGEQVVPGTTNVVEPEPSETTSGAAGKGPPAHANAGGNGGPPAHSNGNGNGNGNSPPEHSNAGGNGKGNAGGNGNGPTEHSNAGGNGNGNGHGSENSNGNGNGPPEHSNAGGNGKGKGRE